MSKVIEHKYVKIKVLGDEENKDIFLFPDDEIILEEKIDGANFRFMKKDGVLYFGTHTCDITQETEKDWLRCMNFIRDNINLERVAEGFIYFGECCKKHTLNYDWDKMPPFLGFDILHIASGRYMDSPWVGYDMINLPFVPVLEISRADGLNLPITDEHVPISKYSLNKAEGIVFKNYKRQIFAKYVREEFKEKNAEVFGRSKKHAENDNEFFVSCYYTNARIEKQVFKLIDEGIKLELAMMRELPRRVYMDIWEEEWRDIARISKTFNFAQIQKDGTKRCLVVLKNIIQNNLLKL